MTIYNSTNVQNKTGVSGGGIAGSVLCAYAEVSCAAAPSTSDTLNFFYLPAGARVLSMTLEATDMDTDVVPTLTINVGDSGSATRFFSASTVGQAGTASVMSATTGIHYVTTEKTLIKGVAANDAATGAAGTLSLSCTYMV